MNFDKSLQKIVILSLSPFLSPSPYPSPPHPQQKELNKSAQLARALFDNVAECPEELSFRRGDLMLVLQPEVPGLAGWHLCSLHGQQGIVPANRVHVLPKPGPPDLSPAPRKESASAALYNPPRGQRSSSAGQKEEQQEVRTQASGISLCHPRSCMQPGNPGVQGPPTQFPLGIPHTTPHSRHPQPGLRTQVTRP
uniref:SH3 domain-containing protein n=1 Tax=Chelonoidis abingdonii TaxID=106734 RepID=A0A8C0G1G9_CHEAB